MSQNSADPDEYDLDYDALASSLLSLQHLQIDRRRINLAENFSDLLVQNGTWNFSRATLDSGSDVARVVGIKELRWMGVLNTDSQRGVAAGRMTFRLVRELKVWSELAHPNILKLIGFHLDLKEMTAFIVTEYDEHRMLSSYLNESEIGETRRLEIALQVALGLQYLHDRSICHGDLNPNSVLVQSEGRPVLADFGLSKKMDYHGLTTSRTIKGTFRYFSPELVTQQEPRHTFATDIWSFGCLLMMILTGEVPFNNETNDGRIILKLIRFDPPANVDALQVPQPIRNLLRRCWITSSSDRANISNCVEILQNLINEPSRRDNVSLSADSSPSSCFSSTGLNKTFVMKLLGSNSSANGDELDHHPSTNGDVGVEELPGRIQLDNPRTGTFQMVHKGTWYRPDGLSLKVALKTLLPSTRDDTRPEAAKELLKRLSYEANLWLPLRHPNVLPLYGLRTGKDPCLVMPFLENGDAARYLANHADIGTPRRLQLIRDAAMGLSYLHQQGICHGDVKPSNVLITADISAVLCDFGFSRRIDDLPNFDVMGFGTRGYQAPEVINGGVATIESDVFSFGGLILSMLTDKVPFFNLPLHQCLLAVVQGRCPDPVDYPELRADDPLWGSMRRTWELDPLLRPTMRQVVTELL